MKKPVSILITFYFLLLSFALSAQQRFPKPEFESGYVQPGPVTPAPRSGILEYFDVAVLLAALSLGVYFTLKRRSRQGILWLSVFSLVYFGFYRKGCICSVGAIQNIVLALADPSYSVPVTALLFFMLPLVFALFFGRVFCAGACPLGAIQDLVIIKPVSIPVWLRKTLGILPYIYLALAILYAVTGTDFIICRYDPFVGFFRMDAGFHMVILGISFLLIGMFVGRPYCRFLCPYGALLNIFSRFSRRHLQITPSKCIRCKLCTTSCPFDAIEYPAETQNERQGKGGVRRFLLYAAMIPVWVFIGGFAGSQSHTYLSKAHPDVYLAELLIAHPELRNDPKNIDIQTFMASGKSMEKLVEETKIIRHKFYVGGWVLGGLIGLATGLTLLNLAVYRRRENYEPNKGECFSCGRCMDYCPVEK